MLPTIRNAPLVPADNTLLSPGPVVPTRFLVAVLLAVTLTVAAGPSRVRQAVIANAANALLVATAWMAQRTGVKLVKRVVQLLMTMVAVAEPLIALVRLVLPSPFAQPMKNVPPLLIASVLLAPRVDT